MQDYPSLERGVVLKGRPIYAFDKLDGSQIRVEWGKKKKFWKFGTRKQLINEKDKEWGEVVGLVIEKYEKDLHDVFSGMRTPRKRATLASCIWPSLIKPIF